MFRGGVSTRGSPGPSRGRFTEDEELDEGPNEQNDGKLSKQKTLSEGKSRTKLSMSS